MGVLMVATAVAVAVAVVVRSWLRLWVWVWLWVWLRSRLCKYCCGNGRHALNCVIVHSTPEGEGGEQNLATTQPSEGSAHRYITCATVRGSEVVMVVVSGLSV